MKIRKKWLFPQIDNDKALRISEKFNVSPLVAKILCARGLSDNSIRDFLCIDESFFYNPFLLNDMEQAVKRLDKAISNREKVAVYGDYDVDGITATYIMYDYLKTYLPDCIYYIPNRLNEGYGMNNDAIDKLKEMNVSLIVTVDVGITAIAEVEYAKSLGIETIITDHHELKETLPEAVAVINPKIRNSDYPFESLAGVGVAFKLIYAHSGMKNEIISRYCDIVAIGTIADMVPLLGENRYVTALGIEKLRHTSNKGLKAIMSVAGISQEDISSSDISFSIAPRINAAGRMANAVKAVDLLLETDLQKAYIKAEELDALNKERQSLEQNIFNEATNIIEENRLYEKNCIIVAKEGWAHGVIGIVSSKITDKYYKPSAVISINEDGSGKASGRSIKGINLFDVLNTCTDRLSRFGGHELAAGFTVKPGEITSFYNEIDSTLEKMITKEIATPTISIDCVIEPEDINLSEIEKLRILEPYGIGNKGPVFYLKDLRIDSVRYTQNAKHAFLSVSKNGCNLELPAFSMTDTVKDFGTGDYIDVVGTMGTNTFKGITRPQFVIREIDFSPSCGKVTRRNLEVIFKSIKNHIVDGERAFCDDDVIRCEVNETHKFSNPKIATALKVFEELDILNISKSDNKTIISKGPRFFDKNDLCQSLTFRNFSL